MKSIRIGNAAGFWGDNLDAPRILCDSTPLDYLTLEYLAELTMSILAHQKSRDPQAGYATDFTGVVESLLGCLQEQRGVKIVTNAGGINPRGCAVRVSEVLAAAGLPAVKVAIVTGDDVLPDLDAHQAAGEEFRNLDSGRPLSEVRDRLASANAYLGAKGIVDALQAGARIVITGRVADASLTLGPAIHEFGWKWDDWDLLAQATVAGHIIECGAQATGGMYSDWTEAISLGDVGYPVAEISANGSVVITKPDGSGGEVSIGTVSEQLLYEIGDPAHYLTPDVDVDFTQLRLEQTGPDRVRVSGARGQAPPETHKASFAWRDGYQMAGTIVVCGHDARAKARKCADIIFERARRAGANPAHTNVECLGTGDSVPGVWPEREEPWEVVLRISARDPSRETLERFAREFAPLVTAGPPGVTGYTGGRARPTTVFAFWPTTIRRDRLTPRSECRTAEEWLR